MVESRATKILNLLTIIGSKSLESDLPVDLSQPILYRYLNLISSVYANSTKGSYIVEIEDNYGYSKPVQLEILSKYLFSDNMKAEIASLQTELIENALTNIILNQNKPTEVTRKNNKVIKYRDSSIKGKTQQLSLINLESVLNKNLSRQITKNMGSGLRTDVLNYQSGRFANTVTVNKLQLQRDGAIAIFYHYMKYPYQTFEKGYEQGSPESRDPRHLISQSIHEIASELVSNKLRAIRL
jgi:hypothetical protein